MLDPAAFPGIEAFTVAVRQTRRVAAAAAPVPRRRLGPARRREPPGRAVKPLLAPLTAAGFRVDRVVSPCNALAALARA